MTAATIDLGFDLGTTVSKLTMLDQHGVSLGDLSVPTRWTPGRGGQADRAPEDLLGDVEDLLASAGETLGDRATIRSIGFTSIAESGVLVDHDGHPRSRIIAWFDPRGTEQAARLPEPLARSFSSRTGLAITQVPSLFKLAWMRENGLALDDLQWLSVPEYVIAHLGGRRIAERSLIGRTGLYDLHDDAPYADALRHLGVGPDFIPPVVGAGTPAGSVRADHPVAAVRGAVLTVAGHDHAVAAAGAGSAAAGSAMDSMGTAEALVVASDFVPAPETVGELVAGGISVYPHVVHGTTGLLAGMRTGLVLKRVLRLLGADDEAGRARIEDALASVAAPQSDSPPVIEVSGFAMTDNDVHISISGDTPDPGLLWQAALARSTSHAQDLLDRLGRAGVPIERLVLAGGWSAMPSVLEARRALADTVVRAEVAQPGPRAAALFGRWAASLAAQEAGYPVSGDRRPPAAYFTAPDQRSRSPHHQEVTT